MKRPTGDEQDVIRLDHAVFGVDRGALDQWQKIALHTLTRHIGAPAVRLGGDFVNFIEKHNTVLLNPGNGLGTNLFFIDPLCGLFVLNCFKRFGHFQFAQFLLAARDILKHGLQLACELFHTGGTNHIQRWWRSGHFNFDFLVIELTGKQFLAKTDAGSVFLCGCSRLFSETEIAGWRQECIKYTVKRSRLGLFEHADLRFFTHLLECDFNQIANDGVHIAPDIANFGEFCRFNLDEWCVGQFGQTARYFSFADTGRANHEYVFGRNFLSQRHGHLHATPPVAQGHGHSAFRGVLTNDIFVEFFNNI